MLCHADLQCRYRATDEVDLDPRGNTKTTMDWGALRAVDAAAVDAADECLAFLQRYRGVLASVLGRRPPFLGKSHTPGLSFFFLFLFFLPPLSCSFPLCTTNKSSCLSARRPHPVACPSVLERILLGPPCTSCCSLQWPTVCAPNSTPKKGSPKPKMSPDNLASPIICLPRCWKVPQH